MIADGHIKTNFQYMISDAIKTGIDWKFKHIAILVRSNKIRSISRNDHMRTRLFNKNYASIHAEMDCIRKYINEIGIHRGGKMTKQRNNRKLKHISIYVVRVDRQHNIKISKPCKDCIRMMREVGIEKIYYSLDSDSLEEIKYNVEKIEDIEPDFHSSGAKAYNIT